MSGTILRWIAGGLIVTALIWLAAKVSTYLDDKEELGSLRYIDTLQKESIDTLLHEHELTSRVLAEREQQRVINDATSTQARQAIYEAKTTEADIDRPLPDSLVQPLRMQYQAITTGCEGGENATACGLDDGTNHTRAAQSIDSAQSGSVVQ